MKHVHRLTLEEKVGQLFFLGFPGYEPDANTRALLQLIQPGGIILSQRNIESFDQIHRLTDGFVEGWPIPTLVGIAQEGGAVDRLKQVFGPIPSMRQAAEGGVSQVRFLARIVALELEAAGFNASLGPVLDLDTPGALMHERTLSSDPREVSRLAAAFCEELSERGILFCVKHFPGLGAARQDPHFGLPKIDKLKRQLLQEDILPFLDLIDAAPMMMVSHAYYPGLMDDQPMPASLSPKVAEGLLRKKLGFEGVILTDDLTMGAVNSMGLTPDLFLQAFEAGNDMLLFSQSTPLVEQAFRTITRAVRTSAALRARLDRSIERILLLKRKIPLVPLRYRPQMRARILRQIDRIGKTVEIRRRTHVALGLS
jgi:beta-N-acetylhexosaminidase